MIDADHMVLSIRICDIPDWIKDQFVRDTPFDSIDSLTFFYHPGADAIVLNRDHKCADLYELLVVSYMTATDKKRRKLKRMLPADLIGTSLDLLDYVIDQRRCKNGCKV